MGGGGGRGGERTAWADHDGDGSDREGEEDFVGASRAAIKAQSLAAAGHQVGHAGDMGQPFHGLRRRKPHSASKMKLNKVLGDSLGMGQLRRVGPRAGSRVEGPPGGGERAWPVRPDMAIVSPSDVATIMEMGFTEHDAERALLRSHGSNVQEALMCVG